MKSFIKFIGCIILVFLFIGLVEADPRRITTTYRYQGLSTDTKATTNVLKGSTFYEEDTGTTYIYNGSAWVLGLQAANAVGDSTGESLIAPGISSVIYVRGFTIAGFLFEITQINTNATIGLEAKVGTSGWTNLDVDPTTYTSDGNEGLVSSNIANIDSLRLNFSAESGGTDAIITNIVSTRGKQ